MEFSRLATTLSVTVWLAREKWNLGWATLLAGVTCRVVIPFVNVCFPLWKKKKNRHHNLETRGNILYWFVLSQSLVRVPVSLM